MAIYEPTPRRKLRSDEFYDEDGNIRRPTKTKYVCYPAPIPEPGIDLNKEPTDNDWVGWYERRMAQEDKAKCREIESRTEKTDIYKKNIFEKVLNLPSRGEALDSEKRKRDLGID